MWVYVGESLAKQYRYYGIGGWLALFLVLMTIGALVSIGEEGYKLITAGGALLQLGGLGTAIFVAVVLELTISLWALVVVLQGWHRQSSFPRRTVMILFAYLGSRLFGASILLGSDTLGARGEQVLLLALLLYCIFGALIIWFLQASKRVRATYRWELRQDDPLAADLLAQAAALKGTPLSSGAVPHPRSASGP